MTMAGPGTWLAERYRRYRVSMADMDAWWAGYAATVPGMAGSWLSFMYYGAGLWALASVAVGRFPIDIPRPARPFVWASFAYFGALLLAAVINGNHAELPRGMATATSFLVVPLLVSRLRFSDPERAWRMFCAYAPLGVLAGAVMGGYQLHVDGEATGGAGNTNVYAVVMADLGIFALVGVFAGRGRAQVLGIAAFLVASLAVLASGSRAIAPIIVLAPLLLFWFARRNLAPARVRMIVAVLAGVVVVVGLLGRDQIVSRYNDAVQDIELAGHERLDTSLGMRMALYEAGIAAASERPLLGYGPQNKMDAVVGFLDERLSYLRFTHLHNAPLDTLVAAGVPGLLALLAVFLTPLRFFAGTGPRLDDRRFALLAHLAVFALSGTTGALFTHDLLTVTFLLPLALLAATAGAKATPIPSAIRAG